MDPSAWCGRGQIRNETLLGALSRRFPQIRLLEELSKLTHGYIGLICFGIEAQHDAVYRCVVFYVTHVVSLPQESVHGFRSSIFQPHGDRLQIKPEMFTGPGPATLRVTPFRLKEHFC